ncbi:MAG TPA: cytochrome c [Gammaproteobacteria bacterium]|nr:cytochrome c [Gammaproteobacteria bacterium]
MKLLAALLLALAFTGVAWGADSTASLSRGQYLTRIGDCRACHTEPGRAAFSGGRPIETPFGVIYSPNITPDAQTGIGKWTFADFYRAMHNGIDEDGDYLYPAFPFPSYTNLTREDVKAIWNYLRSVEPVHRKNKPDALRWPYSMRSGMRVWRALYFDPHTFKPDPKASPMLNRGAYLVRGLAHCGACHSPRNGWGAVREEYPLAGGTVPIDGWYAPNITPNPSTGIGGWSAQALSNFLSTGRSEHGEALGPMRDVVQSSLQYLKPGDLTAIVSYVQSLPAQGPTLKVAHTAPAATKKHPIPGAALYHKHCSGCHGDNGRAKHDYYPDLHDNSIVLAANPTNLVLMILQGGFEAATEAHPYPYSMPPFGFKLSDKEVAEIANFVRRNWDRRLVPQIAPQQVAPLR